MRSVCVSACLCVCVSVRLSVCASVCPRAYLWNRWTDLREICCADCRSLVAVARFSSGGVAIGYATSGFMDDVTFGRRGPYGNAWLRYRDGV